MLREHLKELNCGTELVLTEKGLSLIGGGSLIKKDTIFKIRDIFNGLVTQYRIDAYSESGIYIGGGAFNTHEILKMFDLATKKSKNIEVIENPNDLPNDVKKVIINDEVTIVILKSGYKAVSKPMEGDNYNRQIGFRVAYVKAKIKELNKELKKY